MKTDLWTLIETRPEIDPQDLAEAINVQVQEKDKDYRTDLLIHDSLEALHSHWGPRFDQWLGRTPHKERIERIWQTSFAEVGFPSLKRRLMEKTTPEKIRQFLEYLGQRVRETHRLNVAGAVALIVPGYLERKTEDVDVVEEIPKEIRENYKLKDELQQIFALHLGHVQSHYFPKNWADRIHYLSRFGKVEVYLLDVYDVFLSKLFSQRVKDIQDLTVLVRKIDKDTLQARLKADCASFLADEGLRQIAINNWKVLFGEDLPQ